MSLERVLGDLTPLPGVRGALIVSREDGIVVADALREDVDGRAVAALAASLANRMAVVTRALGQPEPVVWRLFGSEGMLLAAPAREELLVVVVADLAVNAGELRLRVLRAAEGVA